MAIVLDINILCNKMLDLNTITMLFSKYEVSIEYMKSIDNWMWDNEKKIESSKQVMTILDMQHIVIIKLMQPLIKDMGVYIEKIKNQYLYTLWINTEGYPMLDCEKITLDNSEFYKEIIKAILELNRLIKDSFEVVGIGLETDIYYEENIMDMIENSKNIMIWLLNKHIKLNFELENFKGNVVEDIYVLQKNKDVINGGIRLSLKSLDDFQIPLLS